MCSLILGAGTVIDATAFDLLRYTGRGLGLNKHTRLILVMLACVAYVMVQSFAIWARAQGMLALERRSFLGRRVVKVYQGIRAVFKVFSVLVLMISICLTMLAVGTAGMSAAFSLLLYMNQRQRYYAKLVLGALLCVGYVLVMFATLLAAHLIIPAFLVLAFDLACRLLTVFCRCLKVCFHLCGVFVLLQSILQSFQVLGAESIRQPTCQGTTRY
ncbi:hypothetical protein BaRGS_00016992 [Batillaria attramentaria]|uniref:Uncharacterized protein n=1 Tax=Batillaria attramentaria TaxID=370345 RepID=A0ABD0KXH1_9CAEN|nr:hypothetical protein BaRGS_012183 [Batillaria attramentaria]